MTPDTPTESMKHTLHAAGFAVVERVVSQERVDALLADISRARTDGKSPGLRNVFDHVPAAETLLRDPAIDRLLSEAIGNHWFAVRSILFDKVPGSNWRVTWHQDRCITVKERIDTQGFGPWSIKQGVIHVEPPLPVLEQMVTLRLHLDDCDDDNGPLKVVPASHRGGWLSPAQITAMREANGITACTVKRGGVLLMKPLILHASSPAESPRHRRVLHIECAAAPLPPPLQWYESHR